MTYRVLFVSFLLLVFFASSSAWRPHHSCRWDKFLASAAAALALAGPADASMLTLPLPVPLKNSVALVRAGESIRDAQGLVETQPVKKLSTSNALTPLGREQAVAAAHELERLNMIPTFIFTSNTERAYETATIIARELRIGQNRIVPEFSFLDARGLGSDLEGTNYEAALNKVHADDLKLGIYYKGGGNTEDLGSVSDSVADVLVRARQLLSGFESLYSGEQVLVVSPDSEILSILTAALTSPDPDEALPTHYKFSFKNGEVRLLDPLVVPPTTLVTGQTQEEEDENSRLFRALRVRGSVPATSEADTGPPTWWSLYDAALGAAVTSASSQ